MNQTDQANADQEKGSEVKNEAATTNEKAEADDQTLVVQTKDPAIGDEAQTTTVPDSESKEALAANPTPEVPKKPKMADWADDDSEYDEEEEFNYNKQPGEDEDPCEDDHVKVGKSSPYK